MDRIIIMRKYFSDIYSSVGPYFEKKWLQRKPYTVALCATAKKLAYRLYAVLKRGTPYVRRVEK